MPLTGLMTNVVVLYTNTWYSYTEFTSNSRNTTIDPFLSDIRWYWYFIVELSVVFFTLYSTVISSSDPQGSDHWTVIFSTAKFIPMRFASTDMKEVTSRKIR